MEDTPAPWPLFHFEVERADDSSVPLHFDAEKLAEAFRCHGGRRETLALKRVTHFGLLERAGELGVQAIDGRFRRPGFQERAEPVAGVETRETSLGDCRNVRQDVRSADRHRDAAEF